MKKFLFVIMAMVLISTGAQAQFFKDWNAINTAVGIPGTFAVEYGKAPETELFRPVGYYAGASIDFADVGEEGEGGADLNLYAKGEVIMWKWIRAVGQFGTTDFEKLHIGFGAKGIIPLKDRADLYVEPLWLSTRSRINFGIRFKLDKL